MLFVRISHSEGKFYVLNLTSAKLARNLVCSSLSVLGTIEVYLSLLCVHHVVPKLVVRWQEKHA